MVTVKIKDIHNNNPVYGLFPSPVDTRLTPALKKGLKANEKISPEKAVRILRGIEIKSKIQSFFTKPIVVIPLTAVGVIAGYVTAALAVASLVLAVFGIVLGISSSVALAVAIRGTCDGSLQKMSDAYAAKAQFAHDYIKVIEKAQKDHKDVQIKLG